MINSVNLSGYISNEIKYAVSNSGTQMAQFNLAVQRSFKNQEGKRDVDFINISAFGKTAEIINTYLSKGELVNVDGRLQTRSYENKEGQRVNVTEVIVRDLQMINTGQKNKQQAVQPSNQQPKQQNGWQQQNSSNNDSGINGNPFDNGPINISDDDLPF
ncbi:single-stranded DNA-binding protein [Staphylococcus pseudintermedius]|uniref:single-stranded DNA-binding protein n=1 Tax=Staphylococcus pseudintermedius TaxID=283734 RepID=UPI001BDDF890|nr:single-stranded DNA-binding protein [Staphylococcus pseudintermedius]EHS7224066.1 single-stranded DNA-binding protein [Staphylococcus pseudintermedius]HAR6089198.1 single-stranded DNA-binding protein [Staphylococcus pseudintermedius]HAR6102417.1 single-stranded DNA-binding protein [Staphylococcus pseudintermedius]